MNRDHARLVREQSWQEMIVIQRFDPSHLSNGQGLEVVLYRLI